MIWVPYDEAGPLPAERQPVLLAFTDSTDDDRNRLTAVGYLRYAAGDLHSPFFVSPGVGDRPSHWSDCLDESFTNPSWPGPIKPHGYPAFDKEDLLAARAEQDARP